MQGKAALKRQIAARVTLAPEHLPYNPQVLELLHNTTQRPRVLCTASDALLVAPIAAHLGLFERVMASDGEHNLSGTRKAKALVNAFGERGFDYVGNGKVDLAVWRQAAGAWVVNNDDRLARAAAEHTLCTRIGPHRRVQVPGSRRCDCTNGSRTCWCSSRC